MSFIPSRIEVGTACAKPQQDLSLEFIHVMLFNVCVSLYMKSTNRPEGFSGKCLTRLPCLASSCNSTHGVGGGRGANTVNKTRHQKPVTSG